MSKGLFIVILSMWLSSMGVAVGAHAETQPLKVQLPWSHQFQFAGIYAAIELGFYHYAGFDVTLREGGPGIDPIETVVAGHADYGIADGRLIYYRMQGVPVTALAVIIQHSPSVVLSLASSNIHSPQDLIDKRVMYAAGAYGITTESLLAKEGVKSSQVQRVEPSFGIKELVEGRVDAIAGYVTDLPYLLRQQGLEVNIIHPSHYGVDFYGDTLFTMTRRVREQPDEVRRFREATLQGWRYAIKHPDRIIQLIREKYRPDLSQELLEYEARETIRLMVPELVEMGHMNSGRWAHMARTFSSLELAPAEYSLDGFVYNVSGDPYHQVQTTLWILASVCAMGTVGVLLLGHFNRRLKHAVNIKTEQLVRANDALFRHTQSLVEKERALFRLNHELELRVEERTQALARANQELQREIEERRQREVSLQLLSKALESSHSGILIADVVGVVVYVNARFLAMTGFERDQVCQRHISALQPRLTLPEFGGTGLGRNRNDQTLSELECRGADNRLLWLQVAVSPIRELPDGTDYYVIVCEDITQLKQNRDEMARLAYYDNLTGLENRVLFKLRLEKAIANAQRENIKTALMFIDIDHFKQVNDSFGHDAGDELLKAVAARIKQSVRSNDTVARISGDEFTVLLGGVHSNDDVRRVAQGVLKTLVQPIKLGGNEYFVSASIGISITPDDGVDCDELMKNADLAMYAAKRNGRNNFQFFSKRLNEEAKRNLDLEKELRRALADSNFFIAYMPRIDLNTMALAGVEALVRWRHAELGTLYPDHFITFAEESGFIVDLGKWVLSACSQAAQVLRDSGFQHARVSVNISGRQIRDRSLIEDVAYIFGHRDQVIQNVELEITETSLIDQHGDGLSVIQELRDMGFTLSIDDFGTGYSSLSYLRRLPIDYVKIDKSFVHDLPNDTNNVEIVRAVIAMAHNLKLKVVAEGVETVEQLQFLKECQCDYVQGYYFGKAMPLRELLSRFRLPQLGSPKATASEKTVVNGGAASLDVVLESSSDTK